MRGYIRNKKLQIRWENWSKNYMKLKLHFLKNLPFYTLLFLIILFILFKYLLGDDGSNIWDNLVNNNENVEINKEEINKEEINKEEINKEEINNSFFKKIIEFIKNPFKKMYKEFLKFIMLMIFIFRFGL